MEGITWPFFKGLPQYWLPRQYLPNQILHRYFKRRVRKGGDAKRPGDLKFYNVRGRTSADIVVAVGSFVGLNEDDKISKTDKGMGSKAMASAKKQRCALALQIFFICNI